mgnify:CR=1 FL=1
MARLSRLLLPALLAFAVAAPTAVAADFSLDSGGTNDTPDDFAGLEPDATEGCTADFGTVVSLDAGSYDVSETGPSGYTESDSADCSGTIANGETKTCTITNDDIAATAQPIEGRWRVQTPLGEWLINITQNPPYVFNGTVVPVPDLQTVCGGPKYGHAQIHSLTDVVNTIAEGRTGTDMPSWSVKFAGSLDDQQINDIVNYILSIQKVPFKDNVCINPQAGASARST